MMLAGGLAIAAIFLIVLLNGTWPEFLKPVQNAAGGISGYIGGAVWLVWVAVFIGPGYAVQSIGERIKSKS